MSKKQQAFHNPFAAASPRLKDLVDKSAAAARKPEPAPTRAPPDSEPIRPSTDAELFADAMAGAAPITPDHRGRIGVAPTPPPPISRRAADEAEAYATLADLVEGTGSFEMSATDEFLEFVAPGVNRQLLRRLRRGDFATQAHVDLHGLNREEAQIEVQRFIESSRALGRRCVLIVHGRGLNSKDHIPVLKDRLHVWLERGRLSRQVLAFASARPCDGGTGALYVLLRR